MRSILLLMSVFVVALIGCSTPKHGVGAVTKSTPETVLVTYHVKAGYEAEFQSVLSNAWTIYRSDHLVFATPHIVVQDTEEGGKPRFIEIFTWVSRSIPEHAPESVKTIWKQEESLCEKRAGHYGIEPGEVKLIVPTVK